MSVQKQKQLFTTVVGRSSGDGSAEATISTIDTDRESDVLVPEGAKLANYLKNPVVLFAHDQWSIPVGACTSVEVVRGKGIRAKWRWLENDPDAERVRNAWDQGVLRACSVGFLPFEFEHIDNHGLRFTSWELLEFSIVPVPCNPAAVRTLKSLGLPVARAASTHATGDLETALSFLRSHQKAGRVLSSRNEGRIRQALELLNDVLNELEEGEQTDDGKAVLFVREQGGIRISEAEVNQIIGETIGEAVTEAMNYALGRVD